MVKANKMHECDSRHIPDKSGWSALATITTFDRGKSTSHKCKKEAALIHKRSTFSISSLFVESLIDQLCKLFEKDPVMQKKLYELICHKLYEMKLIDKSYKVEEFQFMRSYYQRALYHLLTVSNSPAIDTKLETFLNQSPSSLALPPTLSNVFDWSRYQNEFEEIEFIDRGGFGHVFRVRNKVDGCEYAIKKICLRYRSKEQFVKSLREVRTLANLDHCNIVAYKAAWFEPLTDIITEEESSGSSDSKISPEIGSDRDDEVPDSSCSDRDSKDEIEDDSGNIVFASKSEDISKDLPKMPPSMKFQEEGSRAFLEDGFDAENKDKASNVFPDNCLKELKGYTKKESLCDHDSRSTNRRCKGQKLSRTSRNYECAVLHIQMQLCKESLRKWLDLRNERLNVESFSDKVKSEQFGYSSPHNHPLHMDSYSIFTALYIFQKILNGVEYVHTKGIVHHDLKPSNIFVEGFEYSAPHNKMKYSETFCLEEEESLFQGWENSYRSQVRVGDFGLSCRLVHPPSSMGSGSEDENDEKSKSTIAIVHAHLLNEGSCLVRTALHMSKNDRGEEKEIIGTKLYAAPEQLDGHCNPKSDVFSLGIILFELLHPFFTSMERSKIISALRSGTIPVYFKQQYPLLAPLIKELLSLDPSDRPSIRDLIKMLKPIIESYEQSLKSILWGGLSEKISVKEETQIREIHSTEFCHESSFDYQKCRVRKSHVISSSTKEEISVKSDVVGSHCSSHTCHVVMVEQEKTIKKLREENLKKDETIRELKNQILKLQNFGRDTSHISDSNN